MPDDPPPPDDPPKPWVPRGPSADAIRAAAASGRPSVSNPTLDKLDELIELTRENECHLRMLVRILGGQYGPYAPPPSDHRNVVGVDRPGAGD